MVDIKQLREYYDNTDLSDAIERSVPDNQVTEEVMVSTSIRLPQSLMNQVRERARAARVPTTTLMRQWVLDRVQANPADAVVSVADMERFIAEHAHPVQ